MRDDIRSTAGVRALWVRFRAIKQDPRVERPAARGSGDWACIGDVPDTKWSPIKWYMRLAQLHGVARDPSSPMFVDKSDPTRPLLYRVARQCFIDLQTAVGVAEGELTVSYSPTSPTWTMHPRQRGWLKTVLPPEFATPQVWRWPETALLSEVVAPSPEPAPPGEAWRRPPPKETAPLKEKKWMLAAAPG